MSLQQLVELTVFVTLVARIKSVKDAISSGGRETLKVILETVSTQGTKITVFATVFEQAVKDALLEAYGMKKVVGLKGMLSHFTAHDGSRKADFRPFEVRTVENAKPQTRVDLHGEVTQVVKSEGGFLVTLGSETQDGDKTYRHEADVLVTDSEIGLGLLNRYESELPTAIKASGYLDQIDSEENWLSGNTSGLVIVAETTEVVELNNQAA